MILRLELSNAIFFTTTVFLGIPDERALEMRDGEAKVQARFTFDTMRTLGMQLLEIPPMGHA